MKHFRDSIGRYTKRPNENKTIKWYYKILISTLIFLIGYVSILSLYGVIQQERYIRPIMAQTALKTQNKATQGTPQGIIREVTMYNVGIEAQTDSSPCISANGENICLALAKGYKRCAANFVPLGTDLIIDNYGECKVTDRMNSRYKNRVDIAVSEYEYERAKSFGLQNLLVIIK